MEQTVYIYETEQRLAPGWHEGTVNNDSRRLQETVTLVLSFRPPASVRGEVSFPRAPRAGETASAAFLPARIARVFRGKNIACNLIRFC